MMCLVYISNARIPSEKAHPYQILKMCEAFSINGAFAVLLHPFRVNTPQMKQVKDIYEYYGVNRNFSIKTLPSLDIPILEKISSKLWFYLQSLTYSFTTLITIPVMRIHNDFIIYSRDKFSILLLLKLKRMLGIKIFYEAHVFPESNAEMLIKQFRKLDGLIVITKQLKRMYNEAGIPEEKIIVAPDAVDLKQFQIRETKEECRQRLGLPLNRPIVGYVGRFQTMGMEKGIPELIQAIGYLIERYPDNPPLLLCVGGPMDCVPYYEEIAEKHNVPREYLQFVDRVPTSQVPYWMRTCDVVTIPWPWNEFSAYYTSPMKLFEYMAVGTPIVASDLPSLREILTDGKNAVLVAPGDAKALAIGIAQLLDDSTLRGRLVQRASQDVRQYTWESRARRILDCVMPPECSKDL